MKEELNQEELNQEKLNQEMLDEKLIPYSVFKIAEEEILKRLSQNK